MSYSPSPARLAAIQLAFLKYVVHTTELKDRLLEPGDLTSIQDQISMSDNDDGKTVSIELRFTRDFGRPLEGKPAVVGGETPKPTLSFPDPPEDGEPQL